MLKYTLIITLASFILLGSTSAQAYYSPRVRVYNPTQYYRNRVNSNNRAATRATNPETKPAPQTEAVQPQPMPQEQASSEPTAEPAVSIGIIATEAHIGAVAETTEKEGAKGLSGWLRNIWQSIVGLF